MRAGDNQIRPDVFGDAGRIANDHDRSIDPVNVSRGHLCTALFCHLAGTDVQLLLNQFFSEADIPRLPQLFHTFPAIPHASWMDLDRFSLRSIAAGPGFT